MSRASPTTAALIRAAEQVADANARTRDARAALRIILTITDGSESWQARRIAIRATAREAIKAAS